MNTKTVAVVLINYNLSDYTISCVESILANDYPSYTIYLVDNGSKEDDYERLKSKFNNNPKIKIIRIITNVGYVGGVNKGISVAYEDSPDLYVILNNDTIIDNNAISALVESYKRNSDKSIISGKVYNFDQPNTLQYIGGRFINKKMLTEVIIGKDEEDTGQYDNEMEMDMLDDIMWLFPKALIEEVGLYPSCYFLYAEQADLALQAKRKGYKLIYTPKAKIWHKGSLTTGGGERFSAPVNYWRKKSYVIFLFRNIKHIYFIQYILMNFPGFLLKPILNSLNLRKPIDSRADNAALRGFLSGLRWVFTREPDKGYNPFL